MCGLYVTWHFPACVQCIWIIFISHDPFTLSLIPMDPLSSQTLPSFMSIPPSPYPTPQLLVIL